MHNKLFKRIALLFLLVILISAAVIYFTFDMRALRYLSLFSPENVLLALGSLALGLFFDGTRLITLAKVTDEKLGVWDVVKVVLSNYFLALVTPGATGGAIAQILFMRKAGVPVTRSTVIILVRTLMSIVFLILMLPFFMSIDEGITMWVPMPLITAVCVLFLALPLAAIFLMHTDYPERIIYSASRHISHERRRQAFRAYHDFRHAVYIMGRQPLMVFRAFIESGLSLTFIYMTVPCYFMALNFPFDWVLTMGRMYLLNLVLYFTPTPGGSGVAEAGFVVLFSKIVPSGTVGILAVLWRFTAEYIPFMLGAVITLRAFGYNVLSLAETHMRKEALKNQAVENQSLHRLHKTEEGEPLPRETKEP